MFGGCILTDKYKNENFDFKVISNNLYSSPVFPIEFTSSGYIIRNQGNIGSCVAFASCGNRNIMEKKQLNNTVTYSEKYIYYNREPQHWQGEGMIFEEALQMMQKWGVPEYNDYSGNDYYYNKPSNFNTIRDNLKSKSYPHRISSFYEIKDGNINDIKMAIMSFGSVLAGIEVKNSAFNGTAYVRDALYEDTSSMGHAVLIIGWTARSEWIVANSWGLNSGDNGLYYIPMLCNIWRKYFVIVDNIIKNTEIKIKYTIALNTSMESNFEKCFNDLEAYNKIAGNISNLKQEMYSYNNKYIRTLKGVYNSIEKAKEIRDNLNLKTTFSILPVNMCKTYYLLYISPMSEEDINNAINDYKTNTNLSSREKEFNLEKVFYDNNYYLSIKSSNSNQFVQKFKEKVEQDTTFGQLGLCIVEV